MKQISINTLIIRPLIPLAALILLSASCNDWLDIKPLDKMVVEDYWKTEKDVESSVIACYTAMTAVDGYSMCPFLERIIAAGEVRSDNIVEGKSDLGADMRNVLKVTIDPNNGLAKWEVFYKIINNCNLILKNAPEVAKIDPNYMAGEMHVHEAEALALRALTYFYLVRIYKDVPYIRIPYMDDNEDFAIPKTDGETILEDMVNDLILAEDYAVISRGFSGIGTTDGVFRINAPDTKGRITKNAIRALLADIYLWQASGLKDAAKQAQKYEACIRKCEEIESFIINKVEGSVDDYTGAELMLMESEFTETTSFFALFSVKNSMESIFELQFNYNTPSKSITTLYGRSGRDGNLSAAAKETWIASQDSRRKFSYGAENATIYPILKYVLSYSGTSFSDDEELVKSPSLIGESDYPNWVFYRISDVFLMKAEAFAELGGEENLRKALEQVNKIYLHANPKQKNAPLSFDVYKDKMRQLVLEERQREFLFEGKRWFDLMRLWRKEGPSSDVLNLMTRKYKGDVSIIRSKLSIEDALYMPIHKDELINNQELEQNKFYENAIEK
jgi:hypothetical protein